MKDKYMQLIEQYKGWEIYLDESAGQYYALDPYNNRYGPSRSRADLKVMIRRKIEG